MKKKIVSFFVLCILLFFCGFFYYYNTPSKNVQEEDTSFKVLFTDMWSDFNVENNMFLLALQNYFPEIRFKGYSLKTLPNKQNIHIFGPFGSSWKKVKGKKVFFTGENRDPIQREDILNVGFRIMPAPYLRMPLWMFSIDVFGAHDLLQIKNPLPLPLLSCTQCPFLETPRPKFCAFIVSNPKNKIRNSAFQELNKYKPVDSAGRLYNTVGNTLFAGDGGGGGELKKHEFLKQYRFCLAYENEKADGYVTEKLLHAKAAGCIPIYWGSEAARADFNPQSFIDASNCSIQEMIEKVKALEENPVKRKEMAAIPLFYNNTIVAVKEKFSKLVEYMAGREPTQKRVFMSFGDTHYKQSLIRIGREAKEINYFDSILLFSEVDLQQDKEFWDLHGSFILNNARGYGYWIWKSYLIQKVMQTLNENDILIYVDAGCSINKYGQNRLYEYDAILQKSLFGIVSFQLQCKERQYTKRKTLQTLSGDPDSLQCISGVILLRKCAHSLHVINLWKNAASVYDLIDDKVEDDEDPEFIGNRHDQSCLSLLLKKHGAEFLQDETYSKNMKGLSFFPFHATRLKK